LELPRYFLVCRYIRCLRPPVATSLNTGLTNDLNIVPAPFCNCSCAKFLVMHGCTPHVLGEHYCEFYAFNLKIAEFSGRINGRRTINGRREFRATCSHRLDTSNASGLWLVCGPSSLHSWLLFKAVFQLVYSVIN
jgi:hypothetical protein